MKTVKTFKHVYGECDYEFKAEVEDYVDILFISCPKCEWLSAFIPLNTTLNEVKDKFKIYKFEITDEYKEDFEPKKRKTNNPRKGARKETKKRNSSPKKICNTIYKLNLNNKINK
jgi:hypothetical protein